MESPWPTWDMPTFSVLCASWTVGVRFAHRLSGIFYFFFFFPSYNPSPSDPAGSHCSCHSVVITPLFSTVHVFQAGQVWRMKWQPGCELKWGDRRQGDRRNLLRIQCQHLAPGTWSRAAAGWGMAQLTARPDRRGGLSVLSLTLDWPWI